MAKAELRNVGPLVWHRFTGPGPAVARLVQRHGQQQPGDPTVGRQVVLCPEQLLPGEHPLFVKARDPNCEAKISSRWKKPAKATIFDLMASGGQVIP